MEPEVHIKKVPRNEKVSCKYIFWLTSKQSCTYRFNHSEEDMFLDCSVVSSLVLVSHLLTLDTCDSCWSSLGYCHKSHYKLILLAGLQVCFNGWDGNLSSYTVVLQYPWRYGQLWAVMEVFWGCTFMRLQIRPYSDKINRISAGSGDGLKS